MKLWVSEMFHSIQGEGRFTGAPSFFVRVVGCNLRCWWCDTMYTSWKPEEGLGQCDLQSVADAALSSGAPHVVLTGGEPMLYPEQVGVLCGWLRSHGRKVTVETNGTVYDSRVQPDLWSVSPKLESSFPDRAKHPAEHSLHARNLRPATMRHFWEVAEGTAGTDVQYKFVVCAEKDVDDVSALCGEHGLPRGKVWLMPEGVTGDKVAENGRWVAEACKRHGFNLAMRVHTMLWGHRRGV